MHLVSEDELREHLVTIALFLSLSGLFLPACGPVPVSTPTPSPLPTATAAATNTPVSEPTATNVLGAIAMKCDDGAFVDIGDYQTQNNTWGKGNLSGWFECIGAGMNADGTLVARWTWDWLNSGTNVKAYPEIIFGQKPGSATTSKVMPIKISDIGVATVSYDVASTSTGSGDVAFDIWLTDTPNPSSWGVPPITSEVMVWLDRQGAMAPGGAFRERVNLDGTSYAVYVADNWGQGWRYIAFTSVESRLGVGTLDLGSFLSYLQENGLIKGGEYLASIEFGNEVATGAGETDVNRYTVSVQKK